LGLGFGLGLIRGLGSSTLPGPPVPKVESTGFDRVGGAVSVLFFNPSSKASSAEPPGGVVAGAGVFTAVVWVGTAAAGVGAAAVFGVVTAGSAGVTVAVCGGSVFSRAVQ
jgi:hypothetical protein